MKKFFKKLLHYHKGYNVGESHKIRIKFHIQSTSFYYEVYVFDSQVACDLSDSFYMRYQSEIYDNWTEKSIRKQILTDLYQKITEYIIEYTK